MGGVESILPRQDEHFAYFSFFVRDPNMIVVVHANKAVDAFLKVNLKRWDEKLLHDKISKKTVKLYMLEGTPFSNLHSRTNIKEDVALKTFFCNFLIDLKQDGWNISASAQLCNTSESTSWIFEKTKTEPDIEAEVMCLSVIGSNKLQLVNATEGGRNLLKSAVMRWVDEEKLKKTYYEITLIGKPWKPEKEEAQMVRGRRIILEVVKELYKKGYDLAGKYKGPGCSGADMMFFQKANEDDLEERENAEFMLISLNEKSRIHFINLDPDLIKTISEFFVQNWEEGIVNKPKFDPEKNHTRMKLDGAPWLKKEGRQLLSKMLELFACHGWFMHCSLDVGFELTQKSVLILKKAEKAADIKALCMFPTTDHNFHIVNGSHEFTEPLAKTITEHYPIIQEQGWIQRTAYELSEFYDIKFGGTPYKGNDLVQSCIIQHGLIALLLRIRSLGLSFIDSVTVVVEIPEEVELAAFGAIFAVQDAEKDPAKIDDAGEKLEKMLAPQHYEGEEAQSIMVNYLMKISGME